MDTRPVTKIFSCVVEFGPRGNGTWTHTLYLRSTLTGFDDKYLLATRVRVFIRRAGSVANRYAYWNSRDEGVVHSAMQV